MLEGVGDPSGTLLQLTDVQCHYRRHGVTVRAVDGVSLYIAEGHSYGLVGESGCGKTTTARLILRLQPLTAGSVRFRGQDLSRMNRTQARAYPMQVQAVLQNPWSALNPRLRVGTILAEPLRVGGAGRAAAAARVGELLELVGLRPGDAQRYPHAFSGGQRQRLALARALSVRPQLVVLDEPVSALDVSIRAQIMNLLWDLRRHERVSYLLIAHDLATTRYLCDKIGVMYLGRIVEEATTARIFAWPAHPYTRTLFASSLPPRPRAALPSDIRGEVPSAAAPPPGCPFHPRCSAAQDICRRVVPLPTELEPGHRVACHFPLPLGEAASPA